MTEEQTDIVNLLQDIRDFQRIGSGALMTRRDIGLYCGFKARTVAQMIKRPNFPRPLIVNNGRHRWAAKEIHAYFSKLPRGIVE